MIKWKFFLISFLFFLRLTNSFSQTNVSGYEVDLQEKTPQSPNAGNLGKYFDIPVNMATGIPNISIPLYSIKTGNITVPIVLSYHAAGVQVDDIASFVGLNWSLIAGGSVVKKTNGLDDFNTVNGSGSWTNQTYTTPDYSFIPYNPGYTNMSDAIQGFMSASTLGAIDSLYRFFNNVLLGHLDAEADEFNYTTPDGGGKFYYNQKEGKYQSDNIDGSTITGDNSGWTLTTKDGKIYQFTRYEYTVNPSFIKSIAGAQEFLTTAWHLTSIADPTTGKEVDFGYDDYYKSDVPMGVTEIKDYDFTSGPPTLFATNSIDNSRSGDNYVLGSISFDKGTILFIKDTTTRSDYGPNALKEIQIYNGRNLLLKKFNLDYFYSSNRLFLKSLQETDYDANGSSQVYPAYQFNYDTATHLPARFSYAQDKWGYYNGKTSNTTSIPSHPLAGTYSILTAADRRVDSNYTHAGMINGIVYPTGGKTSFQFENNRIFTDSLVGGLRIKSITHYDSIAQKSLVTEYRYVLPGTTTSSGGLLNYPVFNYDVSHVSGDPLTGFIYQYLLRMESTPVNSLFPNQGSPIFYGIVEKRDKGFTGDLMSRHYFIEYTQAGEIYDNISSVPHPKQFEGKDIYEAVTEAYTRINDSTYTLIQKDSSGYSQLLSTQNAFWNTQGAWTFLASGFSEWPGGDPMITPVNSYFGESLHAYKVIPSANPKTEQYSNTIANGIKLTTPSFYEYDSTNGNVKTIKTVDSRGDTTIKKIKYACDYISHATPSVNYEILALNYHNMKGAPIEIITLFKRKDSTTATVQGAILYEYESLRIKNVYRVYDQVPYTSFTVSYNDTNNFYKDSHYQLVQQVTAWDGEGRPRTVITNTNKITYVWDEKYQEPTAIANNASYGDVAYTSFEGQSNGSWIVSSSTRDSTYAVTGRKCYQLTNGSIKKTGLTSGTTYIVSYWSRNGSGSSYTVTGSSSVKEGRTSNGWTYYEHTVSGMDSVTISGSNYIDELRMYPVNAQMISYCYEELMGMTSQCDAANHISYYEYCAPDKLALIRDQDKNIVKKICYNYSGQPETCSGYFYNTERSQRFIRNNCGTGTTDSVTYTVPASTYVSTRGQTYVDSLAQAEIDANGQGYANTHGTCIYSNVEKSGTFYRTCGTDSVGSSVTYTDTAGSYTSTISQAYVDSLAQADVDANGQAYANSHGTCTLCTGVDKKVIDNVCETGVKIITGSTRIHDNIYSCTYHYEWSDGSWSIDYFETHTGPCPITP